MLRREPSRPRLVSDEVNDGVLHWDVMSRHGDAFGNEAPGRGQLDATADGTSRQQEACDDDSSFVTSVSRSESRGDLGTGSSASLHGLDMDLRSLAAFSLFDDHDNTGSIINSTKRKRASNYMTPASSYASLAAIHHSTLYHPLCTVDKANQQLGINAPSSLFSSLIAVPQRDHLSLQSLPEETLIIIASFLAIPQLRSLSATSHAVRSVLMTSQAALESIWMNVLRDAFPNVFFRTSIEQEQELEPSSRNDRRDKHIMTTSSQVQFIDSLKMPLSGVATASSPTSSTAAPPSVNLSLLTGLLPKMYPRFIDPITLRMDSHLHPFESYHMNIPSHEKREDEPEAENEASSVLVPVIQFVGRVGTGDRCIKSDRPFPAVCKCVIDEDDKSSGSRRFRRLSSIVRTRRLDCGTTTARTRHRNGGHSKKWDRVFRKWTNPHSYHNAVVDSPFVDSPAGRSHPSAHTSNIHRSLERLEQQPPLTPSGFLTFTPPSQAITPPLLSPPPPPSQNLIVTPHPHSPLFRFLSSLSHRCDSVSPTSSMNDLNTVDVDESYRCSDSTTTNMLFEGDGGFGQEDDDDDEEIGVNNYGVRVKLSLTKCKEQLGKLTRHCCKSKQVNNLRPFVTPIVISQCGQRRNSCNKDRNSSPSFDASPQTKLVVDLTPRLCAYFEVTILKHSKHEDTNEPISSSSQRNNDTLRPADNLAPRVQPRPHRMLHDDQQWDNNSWRWRIPPPVLLPMHPLVAMAIHEGPWFPHVYDGDYRPRPPVERVLVNNNGVHRHECVAVGLSTMAFSPRDKMPGWDDHSYGYHGDDGGIFHGQGEMIKRYGPPFGPGDTVGCGVEYSSKRIFFVKNGEFLGFAFDVLQEDVIKRGLYPTVGVDTECPLFVNFGAQPFCFDLATFAKEGCRIMEE
ncbi:hypothetical protein HJC23_010174 [Cyclotella cryptica]|uniref:B30.2/SPRY domain-containing protein n=1 Tax=Cyclotella cryptica TaxID=29204 RepID=A0ABD3NQH3_9STRA|eukprot:CCRYP_020806-RA/>CCRYP_020806-RA protein AED:0.00 eAED:0.00 QI:326/-1/1/1/-1/1/1/265/904